MDVYIIDETIDALINKYTFAHGKVVHVRFVAFKLFVTVKLPENVLFIPAMRNADDPLECCTMFKFGPESGVPSTAPYTNNILPFCVVG